jgi:hypothetical protein
MTLSGTAYRQQPLVRLIDATECGSLLPTPTAGDANSSGGRGGPTYKGHAGVSLTDWARGDINTGRRPIISTPGASDWRNGADYSDRSRGKSPQLRHLGNGLLNPRFVEWMMGYESGWSEPA